MLLRPFLIYYRRRLIFVFVRVLLGVLLVFMMISGQRLFDLGVFWNHSCDCAAHPTDARILLAISSILCGFVGLSFGLPSVRGTPNEARFFLERPVSRTALQGYPLAIAAVAIGLVPALCWVTLLGWLRLVHAPTLEHLAAIVELVPAASQLGANPSARELFDALHLVRRFVAAVSVGLVIYAALAAGRCFTISRRKRIRQIGYLCLVFGPIMLLWVPFYIKGAFFSALLLWPEKLSDLSYVPSVEGIALHFLFAAACICAHFVVLRDVEV
jgi:hypothetical protein